jgi:hypothetical protein
VAVRYLFNRTCPSHEEGLELLERAGRTAGVAIDLETYEVTADAEAERLRFPGSPTYLVAGRDIAEVPQGVPFAAQSCRAYRLPGGRIGPLPAIDDLVAALAAAEEETA